MKLFSFLLLVLNLAVSSTSQSAEERPLIYGVSEPLLSLNPFSGTGFTMWQAHQLIFEFLLYEVPGKRDYFRPYLAKKWTISKDKKVFEFELRESKWTDGKPVKAEDVKFSIDHINDPRFKSIWVGSFQGIEKVEVIGPSKIRITAKAPQFELWKTIAVSLKVIPKHYYSDPDSLEYAKQALGSGPYKLLNFESGINFTLGKNPDWWGWKDPELKTWYSRSQIRFLKLSETSIPAHFQKDEVDFLRVTDFQVVQNLKDQRGLDLDYVMNPNRHQKMIEQIVFNLNSPLFSDANVRKALNLAISKKRICEKSYLGSAPVGMHDLHETRILLKKAGWIDQDKDGILEKSGKNFEFSVIYSSKDHEVLLTQLQEAFKFLGIKLNLQIIDYSLLQTTLRDKRFQSYIDRIDENQTVLRVTWASDGSYNYTGFSNKEVDRGLLELEKTFDPALRKKREVTLRKIISRYQNSLLLCEVKFPDFVINKKTTTPKVRKGILQWGWF